MRAFTFVYRRRNYIPWLQGYVTSLVTYPGYRGILPALFSFSFSFPFSSMMYDDYQRRAQQREP